MLYICVAAARWKDLIGPCDSESAFIEFPINSPYSLFCSLSVSSEQENQVQIDRYSYQIHCFILSRMQLLE